MLRTCMRLRMRRAGAIAGAIVALGAACCWLWPEPTEAAVLRLLLELHGTPQARFGFVCQSRRHEAILADFDRLGSAAVPCLIEIAQHAAPPLRHLAVSQLGRRGDRRAVPQLIASLEDASAGMNVAAATALGDLGDPAAVAPLIGCLASEKANLRACAAAALGKIADRRAFEALVRLVADDELCVRASAVKALSRLNDPRGLLPLVAALQHDESPWMRSLAIEGLAHLGNVRAAPALAAAVDDPAPRVQADACLALSLLGQTGDVEINRFGRIDLGMHGSADNAPVSAIP